MKTTLVTVVTGEIYEKFTEDLFDSAEQFFHPTDEVEFLMLPGTPGWPEATMLRWHHLFLGFPESDYVFMSDADMLFVADVWDEILPNDGITATQHPGYVGEVKERLPYERRPESFSYVAPHRGGTYYCGGFVGGTAEAMFDLAEIVSDKINLDRASGVTPVWHDESALNHTLLLIKPEVVLTPSYCYPDNDSYYKTFWPEQYERKLVALDKTPAQRVGR